MHFHKIKHSLLDNNLYRFHYIYTLKSSTLRLFFISWKIRVYFLRKKEVFNDLTLLPYTFCLHNMINDLLFGFIRVANMLYIQTYVHTTITTLISKWKRPRKNNLCNSYLFTNNGCNGKHINSWICILRFGITFLLQ